MTVSNKATGQGNGVELCGSAAADYGAWALPALCSQLPFLTPPRPRSESSGALTVRR